MRKLAASLFVAGFCLTSTPWALAQTPTPPPAVQPPASASTWTPIIRNTTRVENWGFFEPHPDGGDPDYTFLANRLLAGVRQTGPRHELNATVQYVQFAGLPDDAVGPGVLGSGGNYYDHNRNTFSRQVYLKALNLRWRDPGSGISLHGGRMPYTSGSETPSGEAGIEAIKRLRVDARLVGEFEWSLYQRSYDGGRVDWDHPASHVTIAAVWPTQGGFDEHANANMRDIRVLAGTLGLKPAAGLKHTDVQAFVYDYRDDRPVTGRPDNSGRTVSAVDIGFTTFGGYAATAYPAGAGRTDVLAWTAFQRGYWYESDHSAWALSLEAGHQWTAAAWSPWLRAGWNRSSGDEDGEDLEHGTFMPPLPTGRKYSQSTVYAAMNLDDLFVQGILKPRPTMTWRTDLHWLQLVEPADRWYAGSGATRREGSIFGYAGRASGGSTDLGTILETQLDVTLHRRWTIIGYGGYMWGGDAVRSTFAGDRLTFFYFENVIQF